MERGPSAPHFWEFLILMRTPFVAELAHLTLTYMESVLVLGITNDSTPRRRDPSTLWEFSPLIWRRNIYGEGAVLGGNYSPDLKGRSPSAPQFLEFSLLFLGGNHRPLVKERSPSAPQFLGFSLLF